MSILFVPSELQRLLQFSALRSEHWPEVFLHFFTKFQARAPKFTPDVWEFLSLLWSFISFHCRLRGGFFIFGQSSSIPEFRIQTDLKKFTEGTRWKTLRVKWFRRPLPPLDGHLSAVPLNSHPNFFWMEAQTVMNPFPFGPERLNNPGSIRLPPPKDLPFVLPQHGFNIRCLSETKEQKGVINASLHGSAVECIPFLTPADFPNRGLVPVVDEDPPEILLILTL